MRETKTIPGGSYQSSYRATGYAVRGASGGTLLEFIQACQNSSWYSYSVQTFDKPSLSITSDNDRSKYNYCLHDVDKIEVPDHPVSIQGYNDGVRWRGNKYLGRSDDIVYNPLPDFGITDQMRRLAWQDLLPQLNDGFSLANFLWELRDLNTLGFSVAKLAKQLRVVKGAVPDKLLSTKTAAELILAYSFAIAPLLADIKTMVQGLFDTNKRVNEFISNGRRNITYHHTNDLCGRVVGRTQTYWGEQVAIEKAVYHATMKCSYYYKKPSELESFLRITGLRLTWENLWNAYPLSFTIDWVLKIANWLRQFDRDPLLTVYIKDYCDSIKVESTVASYNDYAIGSLAASHPYGSPADLLIGRHLVWSTTRSHYLREPSTPDSGYAFPVLDSLSNRELVLAGALIRAQ